MVVYFQEFADGIRIRMVQYVVPMEQLFPTAFHGRVVIGWEFTRYGHHQFWRGYGASPSSRREVSIVSLALALTFTYVLLLIFTAWACVLHFR